MKFILANKAAFTLIELLITILVFSVLLVLTLPSLNTMLMNNRLTANTDMFVNALNYARNTALNEAMSIIVCPFGTANSITCGGNWSSGWIVVSQPAAGIGTLLQSQNLSPPDPTLSSNVTNVVFDSHGITTTPGNFTFCDKRGSTFARSVEVLSTGFIQSGSTSGQAVWDNGALTCP